MAWQLLAAALPAAAKVAGTALSKPREEDYKPQTDYMKKYLSYLRGRTADREVAHLAMQPALRVAGKQGRQMQRQVGYDVARAGLEGSGIEAQMRLSAGQQTQDALATATDKAVAAQAAETARVGEKAAGITAQIQAEEARADQAFKTAESQWKRQLASDASAGITQAGQLNEAKLLAERAGYFGGAEDVQKMIDQGWTPQMLQQETARVDQRVNNLLGSGAELSDIHAELGLGAGYTGAVSSIEPSTTERGAMATTDMNVDSVTSNNAIVDNVETEITKEQKQKLVDEAGDKAYKETYARLKAEKDSTITEPVDVEEKYGKELDKVYDDTYRATKGKLAGDFAREEMKKEGKGKLVETLEDRQIAETQRLIAEDKEKDRRRQTTKEVLVEGAGKSAYKQVKPEEKVKKDTNIQEVPKIKKEDSYKVQGFEDQPDYGVTVEALAPAKKGKRYKIERKGKEHSVIVTNVDKENKKVTLRDMVLNKEYKTSFDKFDEYRGVANVANKESNQIEPIFSTVQKFEKGSRAERHNNLGAVVWTKNLQSKYPEMEKGDSFVDKDGVTRYTAKFPNKETGDRINRQIMQEMLESVDGDTARFYARWSGLPIDSKTVQNFVKEVGG